MNINQDYRTLFKLKKVAVISLLVLGLFAAGAFSLLLNVGLLSCLLLYVLLIGIVFIRYTWGVYLVIMLVPISGGNVGFVINALQHIQFSIAMNDRIPISAPLIIAAFLGVTLATISGLKERKFDNLFAWPNAVLVLYAAATLFYAPSLLHSTTQFFIVLLNVFMVSLFINTIDHQEIHKRVMWCWVLSGGIQALLVILFYFVTEDSRAGSFIFQYDITKSVSFLFQVFTGIEEDGLVRRGAAFTYTHESAHLMNLTLAVAAGLFLIEDKPARKLLLVTVMLLAIAANLLAMSRAATGTLIIMVMFLLVALEQYRKRFFMLFTVFLLSLICLFEIENISLNVLMGKEVEPRLLVRAEDSLGGSKEVAADRTKMWKKGFKALAKTYYMGLGVGNFNFLMAKVHSHSLYLSYFFDFGIIGVGILLSMLIGVYRLFVNVMRFPSQQSYLQVMSIAVFSGVLAIAIHGLVDFEYKRMILWGFLGLAIPTANLARQELSNT